MWSLDGGVIGSSCLVDDCSFRILISSYNEQPYMAVTGRKQTLLLVISLECFVEITPDFLYPFMND